MKRYELNTNKCYFDVMEELGHAVVFALNNEEYCDIYDAIYDVIDSLLIYTSDQWEVLKFYCDPKTANFNRSLDELVDDLYIAIIEIK